MQLLRWGFLQGNRSTKIGFDPLPVGMVHTSIAKHLSMLNVGHSEIYIPRRWVKTGSVEEERDNGNASMAWDNNLSGVEIVITGQHFKVEGTWMVFG